MEKNLSYRMNDYLRLRYLLMLHINEVACLNNDVKTMYVSPCIIEKQKHTHTQAPVTRSQLDADWLTSVIYLRFSKFWTSICDSRSCKASVTGHVGTYTNLSRTSHGRYCPKRFS